MCPARRGSGLVTAAAIAMLLAACTSGTGGSSTGKTSPVATSGHVSVRPTGPARLLPGESALACGDYIDNNAQAAPLQVVLGVVALPVSPGYPALGTSLSGDGNGPLRLFAKTGLVIRPGTRFELIVPARFTSGSGSDGASLARPASGLWSMTAPTPAVPGGWPTRAGTGSIIRPACRSSSASAASSSRCTSASERRALVSDHRKNRLRANRPGDKPRPRQKRLGCQGSSGADPSRIK